MQATGVDNQRGRTEPLLSKYARAVNVPARVKGASLPRECCKGKDTSVKAAGAA